jgi:hypothetical protein
MIAVLAVMQQCILHILLVENCGTAGGLYIKRIPQRLTSVSGTCLNGLRFETHFDYSTVSVQHRSSLLII